MRRQLIILRHILHNQRIRWRHRAGVPDGYSGSQAEAPPALRAAQLREVFENYVRHLPVPVAGSRVLELGPGDSLGIGLLFSLAGAREVWCLDKFRYRYDTPQNRRIYEELGGELPATVRAVNGYGVEEAGDLLEPASFDLAVSNAVLEEVADPDRTLAGLDRALRPGGWMLHQIDLSDYGMLSHHGFSRLEFLTIPDAIYRAMTDSAGGPNRRLVDYYRDRMRELGYQARFTITHLHGRGKLATELERITAEECGPERVAEVERIRPRLLARWRRLAAEDLLVHGLFLAAKKPG